MVELRLYKIAHWARAFHRQVSGTKMPEGLSIEWSAVHCHFDDEKAIDAKKTVATGFATGYFLRFWSPRSPSPFLATMVAFVRRSAANERPTSSLSLNWPPLLRRTYRLSPLCGSISSRGIILSYGKTPAVTPGDSRVPLGIGTLNTPKVAQASHGFRVPSVQN
jgi:hypothetical protein